MLLIYFFFYLHECYAIDTIFFQLFQHCLFNIYPVILATVQYFTVYTCHISFIHSTNDGTYIDNIQLL